MPPQKTERGELLTACPDPLDGDVRVLLDELDICLRLPGKVLLHNVSKQGLASGTRDWRTNFFTAVVGDCQPSNSL
jgi:hypothetical protein